MRIQYVHASKFGNGAAVAEEFRQRAADRGVTVDVHHVRDVRPTDLPSADLYVFSSPGRMGRPIGSMRRFLRRLALPAGTRYALLTTEATPRPDETTGQVPTDEERSRQRVRPMMHEILQGVGMVEVGEAVVHVTALKGPLEDGWERTVASLLDRVLARLGQPT
jgi:multimeric flavodoxin WrbA